MIASFSKNFIFVRSRKTASTSTEIVLGGWCSGDDIVVPVGVDDEITRLKYGGRPQNFSTDSALEAAYQVALSSGDRKKIAPLYKKVMQALRFHHHMTAVEARTLLPEEFWHSARKIAVDRHPYEKAVSLARWRGRQIAQDDEQAHAGFLQDVVEKGEYRNFDLYSEDGKVVVDTVIRYEDLWDELADFALSIGERLPDELPMAKAQYRKDRRPAAEILTRSQKDRICQHCREEFELLGYQY